MFRTLDPQRIIGTLAKLEIRIEERFASAGLVWVCRELRVIAESSFARIEAIGRPNILLRVGVAAVVLIALFLLGAVLSIIEFRGGAENLSGLLQGIEAFISILVFAGAGVFFLVTLEQRLKRRNALADLHELRSIAHVIDMHQLTKDPSSTVSIGASTPSSPARPLTLHELGRYLDYCSEMLSLSAKIAALYAQALNDAAISTAVSEIERMTSSLSQKIWQKIMIIESAKRAGVATIEPERPAGGQASATT